MIGIIYHLSSTMHFINTIIWLVSYILSTLSYTYKKIDICCWDINVNLTNRLTTTSKGSIQEVDSMESNIEGAYKSS